MNGGMRRPRPRACRHGAAWNDTELPGGRVKVPVAMLNLRAGSCQAFLAKPRVNRVFDRGYERLSLQGEGRRRSLVNAVEPLHLSGALPCAVSPVPRSGAVVAAPGRSAIISGSADAPTGDVPTGFGRFRETGQVAQSVEQRTENPCVGGSIPSLATSIYPGPSPPDHGVQGLRSGLLRDWLGSGRGTDDVPARTALRSEMKRYRCQPARSASGSTRPAVRRAG